ncbi:MAG TPA: hypothetical protein VHS31_16425 [Tepidisphaeraceae bacterium]|jgi:hypothetical protein|nr:hypothetical protein [Tepidisphaeraceae bacterium]
MRITSACIRVLIAFTIIAVLNHGAFATVVWTEGTNGDLSSNQASPTALTFTTGTNSIIGSVGTPDNQDWITFTIPAGFQLSSDVLAAYSSTDAQGFTGVQRGTSFSGSTFDATKYLGYAHFGTGAANGSLPPTDLRGTDLLPIMGNTTLAAGSQGFTPPLGSGDYTFLIQQTGAANTAYQFDFNVTATPEPGMGLVGLGGVVVLRRCRKRAQLKF